MLVTLQRGIRVRDIGKYSVDDDYTDHYNYTNHYDIPTTLRLYRPLGPYRILELDRQVRIYHNQNQNNYILDI